MNIVFEHRKAMYVHINIIRTQLYPSDLETQFVRRSKHSLSLL